MSETKANPSLFPMIAPQRAPGGLAALAGAGEHVGSGHDIEFKTLPTRTILNKTASKRRLSLAYSVNPYRGCEFACRYCYARYTHGFFASGEDSFEDPQTFEKLIFVKENAAWLLEQELRSVDQMQEIALGTATDPYQPIERTAKVTRSLLEVFARKQGFRLGIVTKSQLILRDLDLLKKIAARNTLVIHLTITTPDAVLARKLEPRAPRPDLRLAAVQQMRKSGPTVGILCSPLLPGITDSWQAIDTMASHAVLAGASFFAAEPLFLKPCSRPTYLSFVRYHFPDLEAETATRFADHDFADCKYRDQLSMMVRNACRRHGIPQRSTDALLTRDVGLLKNQSSRTEQAELFAHTS